MTGRDTSNRSLGRRDALKLGAAGLGAAAAGTSLGSLVHEARAQGAEESGAVPQSLGPAPAQPFSAPPLDTVRIGFVGVGLQGGDHVRNFLRIDNVEIAAVCDTNLPRRDEVVGWVVEAGRPFFNDTATTETDFVRMCEEQDLDLVFNATPWRWHVPVCVAAMETGKHAATEVPAATTLEECWQLVETAERTQKHCVMMENVNYGRAELMVLNMVRQGLFGEILHGEGGYLHDLRKIKFEDAHEGLWRREWSKLRNANLYPTHGLGPIANCMDINRGDRFATLVSMSSPSRGLQEYAEAHYPEGHPKRQERYVLGDVNVSLIQTARGRTIYVSHDTNLPRPYSRIHLVQGTKGLFQGYPNRVYVEGASEEHAWDDMEAWYERFEHPLWKKLREDSVGGGHGGMDFIEDWRLIQCLREGTPTDMNVYDAAALSAVIELSERSVASGSAPQDFPDFTRGGWERYPPLEIVGA
jgi:predicted dehydrogenase